MDTMPDPLQARVRRTVVNLLNGAAEQPIDPDANLFGLGLDSVNAVNLVAGLEQEFGIEFGFDEIAMDTFRTLSSVTQAVRAKLGP